MSRKNESEEPQGTPNAPGLLAIEEHAAAMNVTKPVFAAVCQSKGWQAGKKVGREEFGRAVKAFLGSPAGCAVPKGGK